MPLAPGPRACGALIAHIFVSDVSAISHACIDSTTTSRPCYTAGMKRVLLTGMSGTGKSTLICALAARGYKAIDTDTDEWSTWVTVLATLTSSGAGEERDWVWREDRIQRLLSTEDADVLFVSGCKSNQGKFYAQFDHVVLLSAPVPVLLERLATRTTNPYGKHPDERARVLEYVRTVEPLLRRTASLEVDTRAPARAGHRDHPASRVGRRADGREERCLPISPSRLWSAPSHPCFPLPANSPATSSCEQVPASCPSA